MTLLTAKVPGLYGVLGFTCSTLSEVSTCIARVTRPQALIQRCQRNPERYPVAQSYLVLLSDSPGENSIKDDKLTRTGS
ncbi:hypothetical protein PHYPO_G00248130 [Pangasianodon hypophthalmus]|uniref:Uncharacterized protein n=1 Tax=Pangasianodon hypophthalmus TaxID=310915 RepID=A0A5N5NED5_PANHP|nr:hypothetical protein PHYPO_G00248130 [Pangasianodon hypophthalmus]